MNPARIQNLLQEALEQHQSGRLDLARAGYARVRKAAPRHFSATHLAGVLELAAGRLEEAEKLLRRALKLDRSSTQCEQKLGMVLLLRGRLDEAEKRLRHVHQEDPTDPGILTDLFAVLTQRGRLNEARLLCENALILDPDSVPLRRLLAVVLIDLEGYQSALAHLEQAAVTARNDGDSAMLIELGILHQEQEDVSRAARCHRSALEIDPENAVAAGNLGEALRRLGRPVEAIEALQKATQSKPESAELHNNLGLALKDAGKFDRAADSFNRAIELEPQADAPHNNLGIAFKEQGLYAEAVASYWKAIELNPRSHLALNNLGNALKEQGDYDRARVAFEKSIEVEPGYAVAHNNLGTILNELGRPEDALRSFGRALELKPDYHHALSNRLLTLNYTGQANPSEIGAEHRRFADLFEAPLLPARKAHQNSAVPDRRLRIGYVSGDFREHSVAHFITPIVAHHDRGQFEIYAYYNHRIEDEVTRYLKTYVDLWLPVWLLNDDDLAERIRQDKIDILIDLSGHTAGNRLLVFARKPAPIQMTMIGYMQTTGLQAIDYRVTDSTMDPVGEADPEASEQLLHLQAGASPFRPPEDCPAINPLPARSHGYLTFGSFNNLAKVSAGVIDAWVRILKRVPDARMLIVGRSGSRIESAMTEQGIEPTRLEFIERQPRDAYLALHHRVDLLLDTFPYNGGTTSLNAIWMGVPFVTLAGSSAVGRAGANLLNVLGLKSLVADSVEHYIEAAAKAASDLDQLAEWRSYLRDQLSPLLGDGSAFTREFETHLRAAWQKWCASQDLAI